MELELLKNPPEKLIDEIIWLSVLLKVLKHDIVLPPNQEVMKEALPAPTNLYMQLEVLVMKI